MSISKLFFLSGLLLITNFISSMELDKITIQVVNESVEPINVEFVDPIKTAPGAYATGKYPINVLGKPGEDKQHISMDANSESRFARTLGPMGRFDILNFARSQKLTARLLKPKAEKAGVIGFLKTEKVSDELNLKPYLEKIFDKPGIKVVHLKIQDGKLMAQAVVEKKTLEELNLLAEGKKVAQGEGLQKAFEKAAGREQAEIKSEKSDEDWFETTKKEMMSEKDGLGSWGKLISIIFDDSKKLTEEGVYRELGLSKSPTAQEFFNPVLAGLKPNTKTKAVYQKLVTTFITSRLPQKWNPFVAEKNNLVYRMILEQSKKI